MSVDFEETIYFINIKSYPRTLYKMVRGEFYVARFWSVKISNQSWVRVDYVGQNGYNTTETVLGRGYSQATFIEVLEAYSALPDLMEQVYAHVI